MRKMKQGLAVALAATMVIGSGVTAFAEDPVTSGNTIGTGTSAGHVEQKTMNVILPTDPVDTSTFSYTMDPERLISGTSGKKYEDGATFPTSDDTGVYFLTGEKKYENSSKQLEVKNQSSHDIELTVKAEVQNAADTDIPLVAKDALSTATDASLYLGLVVGTNTGEAISKEDAVTKTVTIAGSPSNFKVDVTSDKSGYEYRALTLDEYKALDGNSAATEIAWESETFNLEGSVTSGKEITSTTTAPTVKVTWSWAEPTSVYTMASGSPVVVNLGTNAQISALTWNGEALAAGSQYTYANGTLTIASPLIDYWINAGNTEIEVVATFSDSTVDPVTVKMATATE